MSELALLGGDPVIDSPLPRYNSIGDAEVAALQSVAESGLLSGFYGSWRDEFFGGPRVRGLEERWAERFGVNHAVAMNSATSGLYAAMGALGIRPGDEVIVPPWSMSATVVCPLLYGGVPVFVDLESETFCLDPDAVANAITPRTKAILAVNLFGHPARLDALRSLAERHDIALIEDNAQAPLAQDGDRYTGTIGDIGIFSLNYHKHIHTGEGGICVTDDEDLARRLQLVRNHGENVVKAIGIEDITNLVGFNFRMTEMAAAVGIEQLKAADLHVRRRQRVAEELSAGVRGLAGLRPPAVRDGCRHVYYMWALSLETDRFGVSRDLFARALRAEGFPVAEGYVQPLYLLPLFQQRNAFGGTDHPIARAETSYSRGTCPVAERLEEKEVLLFQPPIYDIDEHHAKGLVEALRKVHDNIDRLAEAELEEAA